MNRRTIRILVPMLGLVLGCPAGRHEMEDKGTESPPTLTAPELAALEVGQPGFCADGQAKVEFTEPGLRFAFPFDLRVGEAVRVETSGDETLDTVLHLYAPGGDGLPVATDDDGGPGRLSLLEAVAKTDGRHTILLTTFRGKGRGPVTIRIRVDGDAGCRTAPVVDPADLQGPSERNLGTVAVGKSVDDVLTLTNTGGADAIVDRVAFEASGAMGFSINWPCARAGGSSGGFLPIGPVADDTSAACVGAVTVAPGEAIQIPVRYQAQDAGEASARLTFHSTDPEDLAVTLIANRAGPCVQVIPAPLNFGIVAIGFRKEMDVKVQSCATQGATRVTGIRLENPDDTLFAVDTGRAISAEDPLELAPGASWDLTVSFLRADASSDLESNALLVDSDAPSSPLRVDLAGRTGVVTNPVCDFVVVAGGAALADGASIEPLTPLHLADRSYDPSPDAGEITRTDWSVVTRPSGAVERFAPSAIVPEATFTPLIVGDYVFELQVQSASGGTATCRFSLDVVNPAGWYVELTWNTPGDPDPSDECAGCGADLDLHFVHPFATGDVIDPKTGGPYGYFDETYDTYWMNPHPVWDAAHASDMTYQPNLNRDDTDGAGPETFTWSLPEPTRCYRVGVHAFDDHGFGISYPHLRIWNSGLLALDMTLEEGLRRFEMWHAAEICGQKGTIKSFTSDTGPVIIPNYASPF